jgi:hypothetical protein
MATNIFNYDGTLRTTVADGAIDDTTAIKFPGRGYLNYGESVNENMLWLMQNFAGPAAPVNPIAGQAWYDTSTNLLKVFSGAIWLAAGGVVQSLTNPGPGSNPGALWFDTTNLQLNVWSGSAWILVGPIGSATNTDPVNPSSPSHSTIDAARLSDGSNVHQVWRITVGNVVLAIISKDAAFVPNPAISGFGTIYPGINLNSNVPNAGLNDTTTFRSTKTNTPAADNTYDMGSVSQRFANMYAVTFHGVATSAQYADVAERYESDELLTAGTVVCLGGIAEVEACRVEGSDEVFGVVSTSPAYLMNSEAGTDRTHPAIAVIGRVPCLVVGPVRKGQRLMASSTVGHACAYDPDMYSPLSVLGRSLVEKTDDSPGIIEVVVGKL